MKELWHKYGWIIATILGSAVFALGLPCSWAPMI